MSDGVFVVPVSKLSIGPATIDHSTFLAKVVLSASRSQLKKGPFDLALRLDQGEVIDILEWMVLSDFVSTCHFSKFLVAEADGEPIGALAAFDPAETDLLPMGAALSDAFIGLGYNEADLSAVMARVEAMNSCITPAAPGSWTVEWVAVKEAYRGLGICGELLSGILARGMERGLRTAQVSTYLGNDRALSAYKSAGFEIETRRRDQRFEALLGVPGMVTMRRELHQRTSQSTAGLISRLKSIVVHASYPMTAVSIHL
jgi:ribosomal protein S18 acetylase RimI-like enzyme